MTLKLYTGSEHTLALIIVLNLFLIHSLTIYYDYILFIIFNRWNGRDVRVCLLTS